jgi:hypothetical protein
LWQIKKEERNHYSEATTVSPKATEAFVLLRIWILFVFDFFVSISVGSFFSFRNSEHLFFFSFLFFYQLHKEKRVFSAGTS